MIVDVPKMQSNPQGDCRYACRDVAQIQVIDTVIVDMPASKTVEAPPSAARRRSCGCARDHADHAVDATTGPSDSRCSEDCGNPDCAVHRQSRGSTCVHADAALAHVAAKRISARTQIVSAPVPQSPEELQKLSSTPQFQEETDEVVKLSLGTSDEESDGDTANSFVHDYTPLHGETVRAKKKRERQDTT